MKPAAASPPAPPSLVLSLLAHPLSFHRVLMGHASRLAPLRPTSPPHPVPLWPFLGRSANGIIRSFPPAAAPNLGHRCPEGKTPCLAPAIPACVPPGGSGVPCPPLAAARLISLPRLHRRVPPDPSGCPPGSQGGRALTKLGSQQSGKSLSPLACAPAWAT